ncbi:MAG: hypothetical protein JNG86_18120 [Verrucomicrobiaceae bacterium]|nr:hypothetical protein [Verrucomicrobiaceae bacterium]
MPAQIELFQDSPAARAELVPFLREQFQGEGACDEAQWLRRLAFWWDLNPFADAHPCRGWLLRDDGRIVGYLGVIPTLYEDGAGNPVPALIATSWAVAESCRHAALPMGMMFQRLGRDLVMVDTTPSPEVQKLLDRWGWVPHKEVRRSLIVRGAAGGMLARVMGFEPPCLAAGRRIVTDAALVSSVCPARPRSCIQKHITPAYLRWYLQSPMREHHFAGVVDAAGMLTSCLMLTPRKLRGVPMWKVVDWFTTESTHDELHALVTWCMHQTPAKRGAWWPFVSLLSFPGEDAWNGLPLAYTRDEFLSHYHWLPAALKGTPVRPVMAEGDWGL